MKSIIKTLIRLLLPLGLVQAINKILRRLAAAGHGLQFWLQWRVAAHQPGWFDHFINQYRWYETRDPSAWDRGVLGLLGMKSGCRVLDLCCGDGFYPYHFYVHRAARIVAIDYDSTAISFARRHFRAPNLEFQAGDIRTDLPGEEFDNVTWDAGIDYFSVPDTRKIFLEIKQRLTPGGLLSGVAPQWPKDFQGHADQKNEFSTVQDLGGLLREHFRNVAVLELPGMQRTTMYFYASDGPLPLDPGSGIRASFSDSIST